MKSRIERVFWAIVRGLLGLRYRVTTDGTAALRGLRGPALVLPNHPAYVDPPTVLSHLPLQPPLRPLVYSGTYRLPPLLPLMKLVRAFEVPDLSAQSRDAAERTKALIDAVAARLQAGESFLIYPSGRLQRGDREVVGSARVVHELLVRCPDATVVLVRTRGLWGSMFSCARRGTLPDLGRAVAAALGWCLASLVFSPASAAADVVFYALHLAGKVPVMMNWTTGPANLAHGISVTGTRRILTSRKLVDRLGISVTGADYAFLEDLERGIGRLEAARTLLATTLRPGRFLRGLPPQRPDEPAVFLFTSGSESAPKTVPLTHDNLLTNVAAGLEVLEPDPEATFAACRRLAPDAVILEGYGITECSPVVAANRLGRVKAGTIGTPVSHVETLVVDPETHEPVAAGATGMLLVRGRSIFNGYLRHDGPSPFVEAAGRSWYRTGDLGSTAFPCSAPARPTTPPSAAWSPTQSPPAEATTAATTADRTRLRLSHRAAVRRRTAPRCSS